MGLFSRKTLTYVASSIYSLAGDEDLRPNIMKSTILSSVLRNDTDNLTKSLRDVHLGGQFIRYKSFFNWAKNNYVFGMPTAELSDKAVLSNDVVKSGMLSLLTLEGNQTIRVDQAVLDDADLEYWADYWIASNHSDLSEEDWSASFDWNTNEIVIEILDEPDVRLAASPDLLWGLNQTSGKRLIYASYTILTDTSGVVTESAPLLFTYRIGAGTVALDALAPTVEDAGEFFPAIPLRINNVMIDAPAFSEQFPSVETAYRRLTSGKIEDLLSSLEESESIGDIDFAFLVPGVPINAKDNDSLRYLYAFFQQLIPIQRADKQVFETYRTQTVGRVNGLVNWRRWLAGTQSQFHPMNGSGQPMDPPLESLPPRTELRISAPVLSILDLRLNWVYIDESIHIGNGKTYDGNTGRGQMKKGDFWIQRGPDITIRRTYTAYKWIRGYNEPYSHTVWEDYDRLYIFHQYDTFRYRRLELVGMQLKNYVYAGHAVISSAAVEHSKATDEIGFLVPMHLPTLKQTGLIRGTQLAADSLYLVLNSYVQRKQKWYETGFFRFLVVVVTVVLTIYLGPAGTGILGTHAAVGAAIGISSAATASLVGAIANYIAAMVVSNIVMKGATKLFGDKVGTVLGVIATFFAMKFAHSYATTGTFNVDWAKIMNAANLTSLTQSVTDAYSTWLTMDTQDIYNTMAEVESNYETRMEELEKTAADVLGRTNADLDPAIFTDSTEYFMESSKSFLTRTLLTGSDIAELTHRMIENFADITLDLPRDVV